MRTTDAVVIGGGCIGASVLYHLVAQGCTDVMLLERSSLASGSTSKAAGGIRLQHEDTLNTRVVLRSLGEFERFTELTGTPIGFHQVGYLFLADDEQDLARLRRATEAQRAIGVPTEIIDAEAVRSIVPGVYTDDLVGASFCPLEGYATPELLVQGYIAAARRNGARVETGTEVVDIITDAAGVAGVRTATETILTRRVVIAAGVGSRVIAATVGLDLPVHAEPRTIYYSSNNLGVPKESPLVVDFATSFYFHREGEGLIFSGPSQDLEEMSGPATHRLPVLEEAAIETSWSGDYDMSPDHNAIVGAAPLEGLLYATGFSGHGFMQSPAIGEHLAELVLGRTPTLDLSGLSAHRFATGRERVETFII